MRERAVTSDGFPRPFGDYSLLHRLGRGGMGDVFLARAAGFLGIQKVCVLKTVRADMTRDAEYVARFIDEARIVVQLSQRNICPVFDMGKVGESYYLAMEHVAGRDLTTVLRRAAERARSVAPDVALYLVSEILDALDYAHRLTDPSSGAPLHLVHRDVSPHNIMVSYEGEAKLIDFGLAASTLKLEQTESGIVLGKLSYMAPEQARADQIGRAHV